MNRWKDWYEQGIRDLERAKLDLESKYYEWACFTAQQAAEKVIKSLGMNLGLTIWGHSLTEMLNIISAKITVPEEIKEKAQLLDLFYISTRYPNGFPSGKPADYFSRPKAEEALDAAGTIIGFYKSNISGQ